MILRVLLGSTEPQIAFAVVQAVVVDVVNEQAGRDLDNEPVHVDLAALYRAFDTPCSIESPGTLDDVPFISGEAGVVFGIDDGYLAL